MPEMTAAEAWPPDGAELVLEVTVLGMPRGAGSKVAGVVTRFDKATGKRVPVQRANGKGFATFTKDSSGEAGEDWRTDVKAAVREAYDVGATLLDGPLVLDLRFYAERPKGHSGTGRNARRLKDSAPAYPHSGKLSDGTKLARAFEDALTGLVYVDDRRIVDLRWSRRYGRPRAEARLYRLPELALTTTSIDQAALAL